MTEDIVKRLRRYSDQAYVLCEVSPLLLEDAAAEIDRLTKLLINVRGAIQCVCPDHPIMMAAMDELSTIQPVT